MKYLKFYADWCVPCKQMSNIIDLNFKDKVVVDNINIDLPENSKLVEKYHIMGIPALYQVDEKEEVVSKFEKPISVTSLKEYFML